VKDLVLSTLTSTPSFIDPSETLESLRNKHGQQKFDAFLESASKIAQRDMELTIDSPVLVGNCLKFPIEDTLASDSHVIEVLEQSESLQKIIDALISDFDAGKLPTGAEDKFAEVWKAYVKQLGAAVGLKGKNLFHPLRLCLTGRMSGPDVGDQLKLLSQSEGIISPQFPSVTLSDRIKYLRSFVVADALNAVKEREAASKAATESAQVQV